jgi:hypothetical protein
MGRIDADTLHSTIRAIDDLYADLHGLPGYDAVHLASAIIVEDAELVTVTWDHDLADAAVACGYAVVPASP